MLIECRHCNKDNYIHNKVLKFSTNEGLRINCKECESNLLEDA
jgi:uncharacterized Zn finger protein